MTTVSAASFAPDSAVSPEAIVSAFGTSLATRLELATSTPLPTTLAGTTIKVKDSVGTERLAPLFFVSPGQINYLIPAGTASGTATITVTSGNGTVSTGSAQIAKASPGLFTANASGQGVPAAVALRVKGGGAQSYEPVSPLNLGPANEQIYLLLYGTGIRGRNNLADVTVQIGGEKVDVFYAGEQADYAGLDQINVGPVPRTLIGRGKVEVALIINGFGSANKTEIEIVGAGGTNPPQVNGYNPSLVLAGESLTISGVGFSSNLIDNVVRIGSLEVPVNSATPTQLNVRVPFGAETATVTVRTPGGEGRGNNSINLRTSASGFVEDTRRQPLAGVIVRLLSASLNIQKATNAEGSFILADVPTSLGQIFEFDARSLPGSLPFPKIKIPLDVLNGRDNSFPLPIALQQDTGPSLVVGSSGAISQSNSTTALAAVPAQQQGSSVVQTEDIIFEVAGGTRATFPDNSTSGRLTLTAVENNRTPILLPAKFFSSSVAQISPFDVRLSPGAKLTFPNRDNIPPGTQAKLFRFDQRSGSPTIGSFIEVGVALVSADGKRIETAPNAITDTSIYFVAAQRATTTVTGRVVDSDGTTPVRRAHVRSRGREAFTDGNGGFVLRDVVASEGDFLTVDASFQRANGTVDRADTINTQAIVGGITNVGALKLSAENSNRKPTILAPATLAVNINEKRELTIVVSDPDQNQTVTVGISGANFAMLSQSGNNLYALKLMPVAGDAGTNTLTITAVDNLGEKREHKIALKVNRLPVANKQPDVTLDEDTSRVITLTGSDADGDGLIFFLVQNPANGTLSGNVPNLTYTPKPNYFGTDSFTFKVNDGVGDSPPEQISISIKPVNDAPILIVPDARSVDAGKSLSFTVSATDIDNDILALTADNQPAGATFMQTGPLTGQFNWTPSLAQPGTYPVRFTVRDNGTPSLFDTKTVMIIVNDVNRSPTLTVPPSQSVISGQQLSFTISATDPNAGQKVTFSAMNLPTGATLDSDSGRFNWTPSFLQLGVTTITFKATDNGQPPLSDMKTVVITVNGQWAKTGSLEGGQINALYNSGSNLFAGTEGGGIFRSTDQGQTWTQVLPNQKIRAVIANGTTLFAGAFGGGIYRSIDQGQTWEAVNEGLTKRLVRSLAVNGVTIFAGTENGGVFRSINQGQTWVPVNTGLMDLHVFTLVVSGGNLFAGTRGFFRDGVGGVFRSTDNGQNWMSVNTGLTNPGVYALTISGSTLFAGTEGGGIFRSTDNGQNWAAVNEGLPTLVIRSLAVIGGDILAGTYIGIFRSTDNGQNWAPISPPANSGLRRRILSIAGTPGNLFAGTIGAGIFRSVNNGLSWAATNTGLTALVVNTLAANGTDLLIGTFGSGIYISSNNGRNWMASSNGLDNEDVYSFAKIGSTILAGSGGGVYRSINNGQSWSFSNSGIPADTGVFTLAVIGTNIFAGTDGSGVFRSTDQGLTWTPINNALTNLTINVLASNGTSLLAGTANGVFRLADNVQNWSDISNGITDRFIRALASNGTNLFAGTYAGVSRSTNNGQNWALPVGTGLAEDGISALIINDTTLFAGTDSNGVFSSNNNGQSWSAVNAGLETTLVSSFTVNGTALFVGTIGGGVFIGQ